MAFRFFGVMVIVGFFFCFSVVARGGEDEAPTLIDFWEDLEKINVTIADRTETPLNQAPAAVTVFTREDMDRLAVNSLGELLNLVPGMFTSLDTTVGGRGEYSVSRAGAGLGNDLLVLFDGVRLNDLHSNNMAPFHRNLDLGQLERVEILRGPASSLYGSNSMSGVINLIPRRGYSGVAIGVGEPGLFQSTLSFSGGDPEWVAWDLYGSFRDERGEQFYGYNPHSQYNDLPNVNVPEYAEFRDPARYTDVLLQLRVARSLKVNLRHSARKMHDYYFFAGGILNDANHDHGQSTFLSMDYRRDLSEQWSIIAESSFMRGKWEGLHSPIPRGAFFAQEDDFYGGPIQTHDMVQGRLDFVYQRDAGLNFVVGAAYLQGNNPEAFSQRNYDLFVEDPVYLGEVHVFDEDPDHRFNSDETQRNRGVFAQISGEYGLLHYLVGARWDGFRFGGNQVSPRVALQYGTFVHRGKLIYGHAFRGPGLGDLFEMNNLAVEGNPNLKSTELDSFELRYEFRGSGFHFDSSYFLSETKNAVTVIAVSEPAPGTAGAGWANAGKQRVEGVESQLTWHYGRFNFLQIGGACFFDKDAEYDFEVLFEKPDAFIPKYTGSLVWNQVYGDLNMNLSGYYRGQIDALPDQGSFPVFNAKLQYRFSDAFSCSLQVKNLLDREYYAAALSSGLGFLPSGEIERRLPMRGRTIEVGFSYRLSALDQ